MRREILIAGFGGQGIVLAGYILGRAVAVHEGRHAVQMQSYGPEARGGACNASVVVSDEPVDYPYVRTPDVVVLMSRAAAEKYGRMAGPGSTLLYEEDLVPRPEDRPDAFPVPATRIAGRLGARMAANVVMLGVLAGRAPVVRRDSLLKAVLETVPMKFRSLNEKAFNEGLALAVPAEVTA